MNKKFLQVSALMMVFWLVASLVISPRSVQAENLQTTSNNNFVYALFWEPETLDPALDYETVGGYVLEQTYEPLITYNRMKTDQFISQLSDSWNISPDGLSYTFHIRSGVKFHGGQTLTPQDVAYTFWRGLLQGGTASPQWLFTQPLLGNGIDDISLLVDPNGTLYDDRAGLQAAGSAKLLEVCNTVKSKITIDNAAQTVTFHLAQPWSPFLSTLASESGSILNQSWVQAQGGWNGSCSTWQNYYAMQSSEDPLTNIVNGTGPFKLDHWTAGSEIVLARNPNYWRTTPMWANGPSGLAKFDQVTLKTVTSMTDAIDMLVAGNADTADLISINYSTVESLVRLRYNADGSEKSLGSSSGTLVAFDDNLSSSATDVFFNFNILPTSPNIGTGTWGEGVPTDFFSDIHVRKAFNYAFNWNEYIDQTFGGYAIQRTGPFIKGIMGYASGQPHYSYSPTDAVNEFNQAFGGALAANGFTVTLPYNEGNTTRQKACEIIKAGVEALSSKYHVNVISLPWEDFLSAQRDGSLPIFISGWQESIPHPQDWAVPYLIGTYARRQNLPQALMDKYQTKVNTCVSKVGDEARICYEDIQTSTYDDALDIFLAQGISTAYFNATVQGYYYNPAYAGPYLYALSKGAVPSVNPITPSEPTTIPFTDNSGSSGSITIPAGSITENTQLVIHPDIVVQPLASGIQPSRLAFNIQGYRTSDGSAVDLTFTTPVPITITYPNLPLIENSLKLYYWNGTSWEDAACGDYVRNPAANTITIPVCHFSQFEMGGNTNFEFIPLISRQ